MVELPSTPDWVGQDRTRHTSVLNRAAEPNPDYRPVVSDMVMMLFNPSPAESQIHLSTAHAELIHAYLGEQKPVNEIAREFDLEGTEVSESLAQVGVPITPSKPVRRLFYEGTVRIVNIDQKMAPATKRKYGVVRWCRQYFIKPRKAEREDINWPLFERSVKEARAIVEADDYSPVYR